ncbi:MAG TPA: aromatic ring-hydroxylating dioxygenase subunit alpha [Acidimicrobiia bacterium]
MRYSIDVPDRIPKQRYYDREFFDLEAEQLWPRVWQMACRLEEIPHAHDFVTYEILDQSVIVLRDADLGVRAFQNSCRHRGVRLADSRGACEAGFVCPFHGWTYGPDGTNTFVPRRREFAEHNLQPGDIDLVPVRCDTWGGCAWINLDPDAPPLRDCLEPAATALDAWKIESLRTEWWYSCRLPVNWKLAIEAFVEAYHVVQTHPQLVIPTRYGRRDGAAFDPKGFVAADIEYLRAMSHGMGGMVNPNEVRIAEGLLDVELPADASAATATWNRTLNDAVTGWYRERGADMPDLNELTAAGYNLEFFQGFPHWFVLPMYSSASSYRFRPLGPEETLMELWSLTRDIDGDGAERSVPVPPEPWECGDTRWPPIPAQDFSNIPRQQQGLHARGFEFMRLSQGLEGHISNFERTIDGFLAGRPYDELVGAMQSVNVYPFDRPIVELY